MLLLSGASWGQAYPTRVVRAVVAGPPGSSPDVVMRILSPKLSEMWGQAVVVENRAGAAGIVGAQAVANAPADGYTFMYTINSAICANPHLYPKLPYDPFKSFAPVTLAVNLGYILLARSGFQVADLKDLIAMAKAQPGKLNYASAGHGGGNHISMVMLLDMTGMDITHIPTQDSTQAISSGITEVALVPYTTAVTLARGGRARPLAVTLSRRLDALPDVPSVSETVPGYYADAWHGIFAPAGTPPAIVEKVSADVATVLKMPDVRKRLMDIGLDPIGLSPQEFAELIRRDFEKWGRVIAKANIKIN
jgi:tripartite-type tricarboxylate transporter receptor subunit TctC